MNLIRLRNSLFYIRLFECITATLCILFLFSLSSLQGETPNNVETRIKALEEKIKILVNENAKLSDRINKLEKKNIINETNDITKLIPKNESEKKKFFENLRVQFESNKIQNLGPWTKPESWKSIRKRMSEYSVREALGRPTRMKPSVKPGIETVYMYSGDLNADGVKEEGYVNFKDKRVISFKSPHL